MIQNLIQLGDRVEHRGIVVTPLFPRHDPVAHYITLDEALPRGLRIVETSESGSVPELAVENPLAERVLLYDGEELVGAKQNRILNVSVLVDARSKLTIPVSCVEQGRWSRVSASFASGTHISHSELRRRKAEMQASQPLARGVAQSEVWEAVHEKALRMSVDSPTGASSDIYRSHRRELGRARERLPSTAGTVRRAARGRRQPLPRSRVASRCVRATVAEASRRLPARRARAARREAHAGRADRALPRRGRRGRRSRQHSAGVGQDLRVRGAEVIGSGLELEDELVQLSAFRSDDGGRRAFGRIATAEPETLRWSISSTTSSSAYRCACLLVTAGLLFCLTILGLPMGLTLIAAGFKAL